MTDEREIEEIVCQNAVLAALEQIQRKCKGLSPKIVKLDDSITVFVPNPVTTAVEEKAELTPEQRVLAVAQSDWAKGVARGLATKLFGLKPGEPGYEEAVKRAAIKIAMGATDTYDVDVERLLREWTEPL